MKKIWIVCISIFIGVSFGFVTNAETDTATMEWTVLWQGYSCTGIYEGKIKNNKPNGKGQFEGQIFIEEEPGDFIKYEGKWKNGMFHGKGTLKNETSDIMFAGNFTKGKLDGTIKKYHEGEDAEVYSLINYSDDIPYGVVKEYCGEKELIGCDYYVHGMQLEQIKDQVEDIGYRDLLYFSDDYVNKAVSFEGKIIDLQEAENNENLQYIKIEDEDKKIYVLRHSTEYSKIPTNYAPILEIGKSVGFYGYFAGLDNMPEENIEYPCIEMIYADWCGDNAFDYEKADLLYENFINYPYFYMNTSIKLEGIYKGINKITEKWMYFLVEADSYSRGMPQIYICRVRNSDKNRKLLPMPETSILMTGDLQLPSKLAVEENFVYCPLVQSTKIFK